jgi:hypothetical protein
MIQQEIANMITTQTKQAELQAAIEAEEIRELSESLLALVGAALGSILLD